MATFRQVWILFVASICTNHFVHLSEGTDIASIEENIRTDIFSGYSILQRPVSNRSELTTISMSMGFAAIHNFIEKEQIMSSTAYLQLRWMDHRLTWDPADYDGIDLIPVSPSEVWLPRLTVFNSVSQEGLNVVNKDAVGILLKSDGELNLALTFQQTTLCSVRVRYFPFDKQVCPFIFGFQNLPESLGRMEVIGSYMLPYQSSSQWNVTSITGEVARVFIPNITSTEKSGAFLSALFVIYLQRDPSYYISTLIIPANCLSLIAYMTFLAPPDSGERLSVSVSMVLGMTVFQLLMYDLLPISNESSLLSGYLTALFVLVTLTVPLSLMNINLTFGDRIHCLINKGWFRRLVLEVLPRVLFLPPLSRRLPKNKVSPEKLTLEDVTGDEPAAEKPEQDKNVTVGSQDKNHDEDWNNPQTMKLESRIVAVVFDRLIFIVLVIIQIVRLVFLRSQFSSQGDVQYEL